MQTILQAHPNVNVVLGDDSCAWRLSSIQIGRQASQVAYVRDQRIGRRPEGRGPGRHPYKVDYGSNFGQAGYAVGQAAGKWFPASASRK